MIETERLILQPLTFSQLVKYFKADHSLEAELNLNESTGVISPELQQALEQTILPNVADPNRNYLYSTLWTAISKKDNTMVGDLCFLGEPGADGEVEIGYGTHEEFRNKGFMAEALRGMIKWANEQPNIRSIYAATDIQNVASFSVLEKNNFKKFDETETLLKWRLKLA